MTDDRNDPAGPPPLPPAPPPLADSVPPPLAAPPPAPTPPPPAPATAAPAKPTPWGWIISAILFVALGLLAILYFTGKLDGSRGGPDASGPRTSTYPAPVMPSTPPPPAPVPPPSVPTPSALGEAPNLTWLPGTWGPRCPGSRTDSVTLTSDNRFVAGSGTGTWTLSGYNVTLYRNGRSLLMRWENIGQNRARVTQLATNEVEYVNRCD